MNIRAKKPKLRLQWNCLLQCWQIDPSTIQTSAEIYQGLTMARRINQLNGK